MMNKIFARIVMFSVFCLMGAPAFAENDDKVVVSYFYTTFRCPSCHKIEEYTGQAIDEHFAKEMESGTLDYRAINTEESAHKHFVEDYNLFTKSVIISLIKDGQEVEWKNLDKVWHLFTKEQKFNAYIKNEIQAFLDKIERKDDPS